MNKKDFGYNRDCCCLTDREINQILMKQNQELKDRWEKLKDYCCSDGFTQLTVMKDKFLDKMQELEQDNK